MKRHAVSQDYEAHTLPTAPDAGHAAHSYTHNRVSSTTIILTYAFALAGVANLIIGFAFS